MINRQSGVEPDDVKGRQIDAIGYFIDRENRQPRQRIQDRIEARGREQVKVPSCS